MRWRSPAGNTADLLFERFASLDSPHLLVLRCQVTPVDFSGKKTWVYLESIERKTQPLSDPDVQLSIATRLNSAAFDAEKRAYINRLKTRATFSDIEVMSTRLAEIAGQRYWPKE